MTTEPRVADSDNDLLHKWCLKLNPTGPNAPKFADSNNDYLRKILRSYRALSSDGQGGDTGVEPPTTGDPAVTADFTGTPLTGSTPLSVAFTNLSTGNLLSYVWDFGDGGSSSATNPTHNYVTPGTYTVTLTTNGAGGSDEEIKEAYITVGITPFLFLQSDEGVSSSSNLVSYWDDESGNGRYFSQSSDPLKPLFVENQLNGYPAVRFEDAGEFDDYMACASFAPQTALTFMFVLRLPSTGQRLVLTTDNSLTFFRDSLNKWTLKRVAAVQSASDPVLTAVLITGTLSATGAVVLRKNGVQIASGNIGAATFSIFRIGVLGGEEGDENIDVFTLKVWNSVLSSGERDAEEAVLLSKYGL